MHLAGKQDIRKELGENLWVLIQRLDSHIVKVNRLTTLFSNHLQRSSFKVELADGRVFKTRRFPKQSQAEKVKYLSQFLDHTHFPKILASYGTGLLIEWIDGKPLNAVDCVTNILKKAAAIQGTLHNSPLPKELYKQSGLDIHYWQNRLEKKISCLIEKEVLTQDEGKKLLRLAQLNSFNSFDICLTHGDYCLENIILNTVNNLFIIDIENISITALAYDLARTTYRWEMNSELRKVYLESYSKIRNPDDFLRNFSFWIILVLVESTIFHAQAQIFGYKNEGEILKSFGY